MNLLHEVDDPALERATVELYLRHDVRFVEAAAFLDVTPALVRFRFSGAHRDGAGRPVATRHVLAKVSRPEVAAAFMRPAPEAIVAQLVAEGALTAEEGDAARRLPVSEDVCVESDSAGHTDARVALTVVPAMATLRDELMAAHGYAKRIRVGASGGLGAPEAVAAAFVLGADFVVTGSVNQCSPEAGTSTVVKDMLAGLDVQDTAYAPAGDMFELGARVQVVRKGTLFPARGNKLYQLYRQHGSLEDIDGQVRRTIEESYLRRSFEEVWRETREHYLGSGRPEVVETAERDPRRRMALVFRWYFAHSIQLALTGDVGEQVNFQVHCGPAMGTFNRFVKGTDLQDWRSRHVDVIAERLMDGAAEALRRQCSALSR
jgi:trans-AT polyketide synthase/acyltransferase/oxidoreductase domain-containing protein